VYGIVTLNYWRIGR